MKYEDVIQNILWYEERTPYLNSSVTVEMFKLQDFIF